ncbi:MAG: hypothetical protein JXD19_02800 [Deltaproteobacteria bacterium]|nr:hypothetical protein [Deltaproteobacteria bacterium]
MDIVKKVRRRLRLVLTARDKKTILSAVIPGEVLEAEVVDRLDGKRVVLRIHDITIVAESLPMLRVGDTIIVRVEEIEPTVVLSILFRKNRYVPAVEVRV